jgi:hypothetical protein
MWRPARRSSDAWRNGRTGAEHLRVNAIPRNAQGCEAGSEIAHEGRRTANIEITIAWQIKPLEHSHIQVTRIVEINIGPILGIGRAVANVAVAVGKRCEQAARLLGKGMFSAATGSV